MLENHPIRKNHTTFDYKMEMQDARRMLDGRECIIFDRLTIFDYTNQHQKEEPWKSEPCYLMPRTLFSAIESTPDAIQDTGVQQYGFDPKHFTTLRYYKHGEKGSWLDSKFDKVIIDLSRIEKKEIRRAMVNIHAPLNRCGYPFKYYETGLLRVHHYLGSWEQYTARSDVRRDRNKFDLSAFVNKGTDYQLQGWLKRFVEMVGVEKSKKLLQHSGIIESHHGKVPLMQQRDYGYVHLNPNKEGDGEDLDLYYYYGEDGNLEEIKAKGSGESIALDDPRLLKRQGSRWEVDKSE